jgi:hypothetical protein
MSETREERECKEENLPTSFCRSIVCERIKLSVATCVVMLLILIVFIGVAKGYCVLEIHPAVNFVLLFAALTLLAYCEALHYAVVAAEKWDMSLHAETFPRACKTHKLVDTPTKVTAILYFVRIDNVMHQMDL